MSSLKTTNILHPSSTTNNIVLASNGSTTVGNLVATQIQGGVITRGTAVASTSGTSIDFTGIPSWAKRITLMFDGVSLANFATESNSILVQLGTASSFETSSYTQASAYIVTTGAANALARTDGFHIYTWVSAANTVQGSWTISNIDGNVWVASGSVYHSAGYHTSTAGRKSLGGVLTRLRVTTPGGTDTFDAGTINIMYEG